VQCLGFSLACSPPLLKLAEISNEKREIIFHEFEQPREALKGAIPARHHSRRALRTIMSDQPLKIVIECFDMIVLSAWEQRSGYKQ